MEISRKTEIEVKYWCREKCDSEETWRRELRRWPELRQQSAAMKVQPSRADPIDESFERCYVSTLNRNGMKMECEIERLQKRMHLFCVLIFNFLARAFRLVEMKIATWNFYDILVSNNLLSHGPWSSWKKRDMK